MLFFFIHTLQLYTLESIQFYLFSTITSLRLLNCRNSCFNTINTILRTFFISFKKFFHALFIERFLTESLATCLKTFRHAILKYVVSRTKIRKIDWGSSEKTNFLNKFNPLAFKLAYIWPKYPTYSIFKLLRYGLTLTLLYHFKNILLHH